MGRNPDDYLAGASDDDATDSTADSSLLGYLQLTGDSHTMSTGRLTESQRPTREEDEPHGTERP